MHPYRMQLLIKERGKDIVINVERRASLYQTIRQLTRAGLITVRETSRAQMRPERTIYELTENGRQTAEQWLRDALATPAAEYPEFPAAVSFVALLTPEDALRQLETREHKLVVRHAEIVGEIEKHIATLPRLFLLEEEYLQQMLESELMWVRALIADLRYGRLTWGDGRQSLPQEESKNDEQSAKQ
jgi:DNA-binding PadR family transcriptional regulator